MPRRVSLDPSVTDDDDDDPPVRRRKVERSNRRRVICLNCNKEMNQDNAKYHHQSQHKHEILKFRDIADKSKKVLSFGAVMTVVRSSKQIKYTRRIKIKGK